MSRIPGFTLVELLVVITIIVVLLALLMPAMDRAIYQAELALCASKQDAIATGAMAYASGYRRHYPRRPGLRDPNFWQQHELYNGDPIVKGGKVADDRPILGNFLSINAALRCPLVKAVELVHTDKDAMVYGSYALWFDWRYTGPRGGKGIHRLGDRFELDGDGYSLLVSDADVINEGNNLARGAHPDYEGKLFNEVYDGGTAPLVEGTAVGVKFAMSTWTLLGDEKRPFVDLNYAKDDGSVGRLDKVPWNGDERTASRAPHWNTERVPPTYITLPAR